MPLSKEAMREYAREHYKLNKVRILAEKKARYAANPEVFKARVRQRKQSPEARREYERKYREANREAIQARRRLSRENKKAAQQAAGA
jgi:hypothetical protein